MFTKVTNVMNAIEIVKKEKQKSKIKMRLIWLVLFFSVAFAQSPHGKLDIPCSDCHSTKAWKPLRTKLKFKHSSTGFPLLGAHSKLYCTNCHVEEKGKLLFNRVGKLCSSCHFDFHSGELGTRCQMCHSFRTWRLRDVVRKHRKTRFPLTGAHATINCNDCHMKNGRFQVFGLPLECVACHEKIYLEAKNPDHIALNFGKDCKECHSIRAVSWRGEVAFHEKLTSFPLEGVHAKIGCDACHKGQFTKLPTDCYSCHKDQYEATSNPNHKSVGFPTTCQDCHTANGWRPASNFDHDARFFKIYSGKHKGKWGSCNDCHVDPNNYKNFSCLNCHEHRKSKMDEEHHEVSGYRYESQACYSCHRGV